MNIEELPYIEWDPINLLPDTFDGVENGELFMPKDECDFNFLDSEDALYKLKNKTRILICARFKGLITIYTDDLAQYRAEFARLGSTIDSIITSSDSLLSDFINKHLQDI